MVEVVVSRFREDLGWTKDLLHQTTIYNKGNHTNYKYIRLKNIGREAHTYLHHIIKNYNELKEWTVFCQGNPFDHCKDTLYKINNIPYNFINMKQFGEGCYALSDRFFTENQKFTAKVHVYHQDVYDKFFTTPKVWFHYANGAQYAVNIKNIKSKPKNFYKRILDSYRWLGHEPWSMERIWPEIFDIKNEGKYKFKLMM